MSVSNKRCRACISARVLPKHAPSDTPKLCGGCGIVKPGSEYYKHTNGRGGRSAKCKSCSREATAKRGWKVKASNVHLKRHPNLICLKCKEVKEMSEFHQNARARDGRASHCRLCGAKKRLKGQYAQKAVPVVQNVVGEMKEK